MAALFKVARHDKQTERKASSIDGLISGAIVKLKLTEQNYKVYTDDFTEIDEDEILMDLAAAKESDQLLLTIVPEDVPWNGNFIPKNTLALSNESQQKTVSASSHQRDENVASSSRSLSLSRSVNHLSQLFPKFSTSVQTALRDGSELSPRDQRSMVQTVRDYSMNELNDVTRGTAQTITTQIVTTYTKSFTTKIASENVNGEIESLRQRIYSATHYVKAQPEYNSKVSDDLDDTDDESVQNPKKQDEYGCVAYMPPPPAPEVLASLEEKRLNLIEMYKVVEEEINDEILTAMDACYYLQRKQIHKEKELSEILDHWPCFHHYKVIKQHANQLLGKKTDSIWKSSVKKLSAPITRWSKNEEIHREVQAMKKKIISLMNKVIMSVKLTN